MSQTVCVYCGARIGNNPVNREAATRLGSALAHRGWQVVYGGSSVGLMGTLARSALAHGGNVTGIIPQTLMDKELGLLEASELIITKNLYERKALMDKHSDVFLVLPGGFGTLDELMEMLTQRQLGYNHKPIIIVNLHGYYDALFTFFEHAIVHGYLLQQHKELYHVVNSVDEAIELLDQISNHKQLVGTAQSPQQSIRSE